MTTYIVLEKLGSADLRILGAVAMNGPSQAIKELAQGKEGIYVAVPERNWTEQDLSLVAMPSRVVLRDTQAAIAVLPGQEQISGDKNVGFGEVIDEPAA